MADNYDNNNRFGLWRNKDRKEATHPHLSGQGEANNQPHWIMAWFSKDLSAGDKQVLADMIKRYEGTSTKPFINVVIKAKEQSQQSAPSQSAPASNDGFDDDIPF